MRTADETPAVDWIPTGLSKLDSILGGGIPTKRITEISGPFSVGKTTLALTVVANAQREGYKTLWCDQEWSFEREYATTLGVNNKKLSFIQEKYAETALDALESYAEDNHDALIILDAIGALLPRLEAEKGNEGKTIGGQAGLVAKFSRKVVPLLSLNNNALIVLNHEFQDIMSGKIMTSGGKKLEHAKAIWLKLRKLSKRVMQGDKQIGDVIEAEVRKNKLAPTMKQSCELTLLYGSGFYREADILETALEKGIITKKGQSFFLGEEKLARGMAALREALKSPELLEKVKSMLQ
ncbi:MAG: hypothetical protein KGJ90_06310 [Patescibacteria group bacterium]|nr:hypothetical protein [Patescibacteria group bacterium]